MCNSGTRARVVSKNLTLTASSTPHPPVTGTRMHATRTDRALWPRAVMATLLFTILSLTVHLVDITWFDGNQGTAVAEATLAHAGPAPH